MWQATTAGLFLSFALVGGGIFAFTAHTILIRRGHGEFTTTASLILLRVIFVVSLVQLLVAVYLALA